MTPDYFLIFLGLVTLLATNYALTSNGWVDDFIARHNTTEQPTGILFLDFPLEFFSQLLETQHGCVVTQQIFAFSLPASTLVLYEGSRRKDRFSGIMLCLFALMGEVIGVCVIAPWFLAFYKQYDSEMTIGTYRVLTNIINSLVSGVLLAKLMCQDQLNILELQIFMVFSGVFWFLGLAVDLRNEQKSEASFHYLSLPYLVSIPLGLALHFHMVLVVLNDPTGLFKHITTHSPTSMLTIDCIGLVLGCFYWFLKYADSQSTLSIKALPLTVLVGPTTVFAAMCLDREWRLFKEKKEKAE